MKNGSTSIAYRSGMLIRFRWACIVIPLVFFMKCAETKVSMPLPKDKLIDVLIDIHFSEAVLESTGGATKDSAAKRYYEQIYTIHGVTKEEVDTCLSLMKIHPLLMQDIYAEAMERVEKLKLELKKKSSNPADNGE